MRHLTGASILPLRKAQSRRKYLAQLHWHVTVICPEWDSVEFGAGNPKQWVNDYNRKVENLPGMYIFSPKGLKRDTKGIKYMPHYQSRYPYWQGTFSRSTNP